MTCRPVFKDGTPSLSYLKLVKSLYVDPASSHMRSRALIHSAVKCADRVPPVSALLHLMLHPSTIARAVRRAARPSASGRRIQRRDDDGLERDGRPTYDHGREGR